MNKNFAAAIAGVCTTAALGLASFSAQAQSAQEGPWLVRVRAVHLQSANDNSDKLAATLTSVVGKPAEASINDKWLPELDISYFITPNIAAELILTYPQKQDLSVTGVGKIGSFKHLPPTLSAQYHFSPTSMFRPYVGLGVNYTNISDVQFDANVAALKLGLKHNSWGLSAQIGADIEVAKNLYLNVDIKKVQIKTTVYSNGADIGEFKVDPLLVGVGLGMRF
ncbi:outer membrane beta-barrel protein [Paucibacter sp. B2R-40]|uniref:OmpW/AlkL family protein n=1 Tax=Paucibacter sp. B2R-40 TaxID=2893554 RepID=UPI0021E3D6E5|nr:OmpW family outer membrane protein [Paucibacter sp. B2R-40]MCV2357061.1 outer membrane beta-barrel protein [Paucibacter sp. B2R-40]